MKFSIFQESRIGQRKSNQDRMSYAYTRDALVMIVADGMGGHRYGELAAQITVQTISKAFKTLAQTTLPDPFLFLSRSISQSHLAINTHATEQGLPDAPRTTCVVCVVQAGLAYWAHVGDSRLYLLREGRTLVSTRDHSHVNLLVDQGIIQASEALNHPSRNLVYSCLGGPNPPEIEFSRKTPLQQGDVIALCSDGAWAPFHDDTLIHTLSRYPPMQAVPQVLDQAEKNAGKSCDNLTLITMKWESIGDDMTTPASASPLQAIPSSSHLTPANPQSVTSVPIKKS